MDPIEYCQATSNSPVDLIFVSFGVTKYGQNAISHKLVDLPLITLNNLIAYRLIILDKVA